MRSIRNLCIIIPIIFFIVLSGCSTRVNSIVKRASPSHPALSNSTAPSATPVQPPPPDIAPKRSSAEVSPTLPTKNEATLIASPVSAPRSTPAQIQKTERPIDFPRQAPIQALPQATAQEPPFTEPITKIAPTVGTHSLTLFEKKVPTKTSETSPNSNKLPDIDPTPPDAVKEPEVVIDFDDMPINIQQWILDYEVIPKSNRINCMLRSQTQNMDDGEGGTPVYLLFNQNSLKVVTKSNIDLEYSDDGLQIDHNPQHPIDRLERETNAIFEKHWNVLVKEMLNGRQAVLTFGFWPTWPMSRTYSSSFDLTHFPRAWRALESCKQKA